MNSREKIIAAVRNNQPAFVGLPDTSDLSGTPVLFGISGSPESPDPFELAGSPGQEALAQQFAGMLGSIGGMAYRVSGFEDIVAIVKEKFGAAGRIISNCAGLSGLVIGLPRGEGDAEDPHELADTDLAILRGQFGVAENAAVWLTEEAMIERALPFIAQHLAVIIDKKDIVGTMHEAYERIGDAAYDFGVFIAGPSKTADIEQSLVLGAHGPVSMTVFIVDFSDNSLYSGR